MSIPGVGGAHTVTAQSDGTGLQFGTEFASKLKQSADRISDFADKSGSEFKNDSSLYQEGARLDKLLHQGVQSYATGNAKGLNDDSKDYLTNLSRLMGQPMAGARGEGGSTAQLDYVADSLRGILTPVVDTRSGGSGGASASGSVGTAGNMDAANVMLDRIKSADTSEAKADDILDLIAILKNGMGGASKPDASTPAKGDDAVKAEKTADSAAETPAVTNGEVSKAEPKAPMPPEQRLVGDQLMAMMEAPEGAGLTLEDGKGGDMGIGVKTKGASKDNGHDEIGGDEVLKFHAPEGTQGAEVDIVDLFGDKGGKPQEKGIITVKDKDGNVLDTIEIRGNKSGDQTVKIDQPFATLEFSTPEGRSDFAPSGITLNPTGGTSADPMPVGELSGDMSQLLSAMMEITTFINSSTSLNESTKQKLMGDVTQVLEQIVKSQDDAGEGGETVTATEAAGVLDAIKILTTSLKTTGDDTSEKRQGLDALATGIAGLNGIVNPVDVQTA
ncbi:hypothetical protein [Pseudaestuariivita rosea]|uniref:hypothetical protein n=1 Tax=Pseudaestuariivita rosea TaxID=2763263 RepID=UPI001ABA5285|nr:hypothetical protein [Pseudaestuariivita rosea]